MNIETKLAQLERSLKAAKERIDLGNALDRLQSNPDFRKVITEGYLQNEAIRLVHAKADPGVSDAAIVRDIDGIASFVGFLREVNRQASLAQKEVADSETAREIILEDGE